MVIATISFQFLGYVSFIFLTSLTTVSLISKNWSAFWVINIYSSFLSSWLFDKLLIYFSTKSIFLFMLISKNSNFKKKSHTLKSIYNSLYTFSKIFNENNITFSLVYYLSSGVIVYKNKTLLNTLI